MDIGELVVFSVKHNASDLHLCAGHPPMFRIDGELQPLVEAENLTPEQMSAWCDALLASPQRGELHMAQPRIADLGPTLAALAAPTILPALLRRADSLILVTGATDSGKSNTLAAMIN